MTLRSGEALAQDRVLDLVAAAPRSARPGYTPRALRLIRALVSIPALCGYVYLGLALWLALGMGLFEGDALARTANGMYVVLSRDPHVGAIGFIWNPLPSIVQIPLILALDPFGLVFLAGPIHSAAFGVGSVVVLDRILRLLDVGPWRRRALLPLYGLHPMIVFYAANGMSEIPFFFFILGSVYQYLRWVRGGGSGALILFALFSAGAFLVRYEALAFCAAGAIALVIAFFASKDLDPDRLEAILLTYLVPVAYVIALWIFFNAIFVGDPLYFYRSSRSNLGQTAGTLNQSIAALTGVVGSVTGSLLYSGFRWGLVMPAVVPLALLGAIRGVFRGERATLAVIVFAGALPAFSTYLLFGGALAPWLRYFMYSIPFAMILLPLVLEPLRTLRPAWIAGWTVAFVLLVLAVPTSAYALITPDFHEESGIVGSLVVPDRFPEPNRFAQEREIAAYVDALPDRPIVLMDSSFAFAANLFARDHRRYAITSDRDYQAILLRPDSGAVTHVLVADPLTGDDVGQNLAGFWAAGAPYARLEREFGGPSHWRLYRVTPADAR